MMTDLCLLFLINFCYNFYYQDILSDIFYSDLDGELMDAPTLSDEPAIMYYVNDGVYGSFNCVLFDHQTVSANSLQVSYLS